MTMMIPQNESQQGTIHFDPEKFGRLNKPVIVLRKVQINKLQRRETPTADTAWELIGKGQVQLHLKESALPWMEQGLIVNDQPRDEKVARDIAKATLGFAIARSDTGEILKAYGKDGLMEAESDAAGVTLSLKPVVQRLAQTEDEQNDESLVEAFLAEHANTIDEAPEAQEA